MKLDTTKIDSYIESVLTNHLFCYYFGRDSCYFTQNKRKKFYLLQMICKNFCFDDTPQKQFSEMFYGNNFNSNCFIDIGIII